MFNFAKLNKPKNQEQPIAASQVFLARQPIFDHLGRVFAYELLYRSGNVDFARIDDAMQATSRLITNTFLNIGLQTISNGKPVFINLPREFITQEVELTLDPGTVVLEVLEDIRADAKALAGLQQLTKRGYTIALDDFVLTDTNREFVPFASYIKVDVLNLSAEELRRQTGVLQQYNVPLLAEKVETEECYRLCQELGYRYFQGYFFSRPAIIEGKELSSNQLALLNILAKLQNPDCQVDELERIVGSDVGLSFKLLKIINSSYYNVGKTVDSIQQALILLGFNTLKKWVTLITLSSSEAKTSELMVNALLRAKHCENIAEGMKMKPDAAFTVGMFSLLDAIMDQPLPVLLEQLPLGADIKRALLQNEGDHGELLQAVANYEHGNWDSINPRFLQNDLMKGAYQKAVEWCDNVRVDLGV